MLKTITPPIEPAIPRLKKHADQATPNQAAVIVLDPADGTPHPIGTVDVGAPYGCDARGRYLACPTAAGPTKVWRLPLT